MARLQPDKSTFQQGYKSGQHQLVWTKLLADCETPVSAMLKLKDDTTPCFLLESVEGGEVRGRYSIIGLYPDLLWQCHGTKASICRDVRGGQFVDCAEESIPSLKRLLKDIAFPIPNGLPPMSAGLIGYFGYDMIKQVETLPSANPDPIGIPDACLMRPGALVIFDARDGVMFLLVPVWNEDAATSPDARYDEACALLEQIQHKLAQPATHPVIPAEDVDGSALAFTSNLTLDGYTDMVEKAKEYIRAGDIFQVVPSQRFAAPFLMPHFALYRALRHLNPSPFLFYLQMQGFSLIGSSPEILVRVRAGKITVRPIAGTRRRGKTPAEDMALEQDLLNDPKELAEHLMLLDLGRNDVGRCAKTGTVKVTEQMVVERYSHVMHIVSNVEGELDPRFTAFDALMSGFPAGTVSGAPKIRAMEIIDELEPVKRSFYGGGVGYFGSDGSMDTCITLRTGLIKDGELYVQAGGGVVADSDPVAEYEESVNKSKALQRAAGFAKVFAS